MRWPSSLVAFSTPMTRTPVAIGSSVPAWPTRRVWARRRIRATTSCEVMPPGLSTMTSPDSHAGGRSVTSCLPGTWSGVLVVLVALDPVFVGWLLVRVGVAGPLGALARAGQLLVLLAGGRHQVVDPLGVLRQRVFDELDARGVAQADQAADLGADDAGGALERLRRVLALLGRPQYRVEDLRLAQVSGQPRLGNSDEAEPRVLDPPLEQLGDDLRDPLGETARLGVVHGRSLLRLSEQRRCHGCRRATSGQERSFLLSRKGRPGRVAGRFFLFVVEPVPRGQQLDFWVRSDDPLALV